jgi:hypothetical protein
LDPQKKRAEKEQGRFGGLFENYFFSTLLFCMIFLNTRTEKHETLILFR